MGEEKKKVSAFDQLRGKKKQNSAKKEEKKEENKKDKKKGIVTSYFAGYALLVMGFLLIGRFFAHAPKNIDSILLSQICQGPNQSPVSIPVECDCR